MVKYGHTSRKLGSGPCATVKTCLPEAIYAALHLKMSSGISQYHLFIQAKLRYAYICVHILAIKLCGFALAGIKGFSANHRTTVHSLHFIGLCFAGMHGHGPHNECIWRRITQCMHMAMNHTMNAYGHGSHNECIWSWIT